MGCAASSAVDINQESAITNESKISSDILLETSTYTMKLEPIEGAPPPLTKQILLQNQQKADILYKKKLKKKKRKQSKEKFIESEICIPNSISITVN
ncbi:hypothetical protein A3Q56_06294 [Intoshia linei]|uniref:Uncharacterized protein n=1 Tax=Intoshia linei TaxID=1819745 RepID=A0A177AWV8_9BILA|nr:hypothetical protein A3Q56_06294 [Intoshia linei]